MWQKLASPLRKLVFCNRSRSEIDCIFRSSTAEALAAFLGPLAPIRPDWPEIAAELSMHFFAGLAPRTQSDNRVLTVETRGVFDEIQNDLESLRLEMPDFVTGIDLLPSWRRWSVALMKSLAGAESGQLRSPELWLDPRPGEGPPLLLAAEPAKRKMARDCARSRRIGPSCSRASYPLAGSGSPTSNLRLCHSPPRVPRRMELHDPSITGRTNVRPAPKCPVAQSG